MQENSDQAAKQAERLEVEAVAEAFGRSSRLANLLRYIGEKHFAGEGGQLSEYNIATEVFGRAKTAFDAGEDAIARVEAHRLRKRLKDFYEGAGKDHPVQLSIPPGSYVPVFTHRAVEATPSMSSDVHGTPAAGSIVIPGTSAAQSETSILGGSTRSAVSQLNKKSTRLISLLAIGLACSAVAVVYLLFHFHPKPIVAAAGGAFAPATSGRQMAATAPASVPLRLLAGYSGEPQTDSAGAVWVADEFVHGGGPWRRPETLIARTSDPMLFRQWRTGDFEYDIPLQPGVYELHLYFVTTDRTSDDLSTFNVRINGDLFLRGFDVNSDALGDNIADERVFRDISPDKHGILHLSFATERGAPQLNALEVLPGIPHKQLPIRIITQLTSFTDHSGQVWHPDTYYMNGRLLTQLQPIADSPDPDLFAAERYGHFTYAIPVDTRDRYTLVLHFAEFYYGPQAAGGGGTGNRLFRVMCNGVMLLDDFDIFKEAGSLHSISKTFYHLKPTMQGKLNLTFEPISNNATVSGIEVLDESQ